jgi:hypothetical protein
MRATTSLLTTRAGNFIDLQFHASDSEHVSPANSELLRFSSFQAAPPKTAGSSDNTVHLAAAVRNLDLLIAVDNVVAHMAAAMGVATWIILPISPEPRWLLDREDSPWYPTARLYRQRHRFDWEEVIKRLVHDLANWSARKTAQ